MEEAMGKFGFEKKASGKKKRKIELPFRHEPTESGNLRMEPSWKAHMKKEFGNSANN